MAQHIASSPTSRARRLVALPALILLAALPLAAARAEGPYDWNHGRGAEAHRDNDRRREYERRPDIYYSAPPVVYAPPVYERTPGASLNVTIPLLLR